MAKRAGLGKGISELLANIEDERVVKNEEISKIPVGKIIANPNQPRKNFEEDSLSDLCESIKIHGIIQPLVLNKNGSKYIIIAGERRFRAAQLAGLTEVPAVIMNVDSQQSHEIALIENLQRENLNAIEEARGIRQLMEDYGLTQEEVSRRISKSRSAIANTLRLLTLCEEVQQLIVEGKLSAGHARTLCVIENEDDQIAFAKAAIEKSMSVRELEKRVNLYKHPELIPNKNNKPAKTVSLELRELVDDMKRIFATKVKLVGNEKKGRIIIDYFTDDDLERIFELIEKLK